MLQEENSWIDCCSCPYHDVNLREVYNNNHAVVGNDEEKDGEVKMVVVDADGDDGCGHDAMATIRCKFRTAIIPAVAVDP